MLKVIIIPITMYIIDILKMEERILVLKMDFPKLFKMGFAIFEILENAIVLIRKDIPPAMDKERPSSLIDFLKLNTFIVKTRKTNRTDMSTKRWREPFVIKFDRFRISTIVL